MRILFQGLGVEPLRASSTEENATSFDLSTSPHPDQVMHKAQDLEGNNTNGCAWTDQGVYEAFRAWIFFRSAWALLYTYLYTSGRQQPCHRAIMALLLS